MITKAGYSNASLCKKLGIKSGFVIKTVNEPVYYLQLLPDLPIDIVFCNDSKIRKDFIHLFVTEAQSYFKIIVSLKKELKQNGMIWVSWPKKSSKVESDIDENLIRNFALQNGLVDIKVCSVDNIWSALKLVIPVKDRI